MNYHERIQKVAQRVRESRQKDYIVVGKEESIVFTPMEEYFLIEIKQKLFRLMTTTKSTMKVIDETVDIYNFTALFFEEFMKRPWTNDILEETRNQG